MSAATALRARARFEAGEARGVIAGALAIAAALALKQACARAGVEDLRFVLAPSCWLAEHLGGPALAWEPFAGFISRESRMVVGIPCAGTSFLVVSWMALYFACQDARTSLRGKLGVWLACLLGAYLATIAANGTRIAIAARVHELGLAGGVLTGERVHRWLGVVVYCGALLLACRGGRWLAVRGRSLAGTSEPRAYLMPLACYAGITAGVPIAQHWLGSAHGPWTARSTEHVVHTLIGGAAVFALAWLVGRARDRLCSRHAR